jgi:hypothetical protein
MENSTRVVTGKVRFSFPHLFKAHGMEGQAEKFSVQILIPKTEKETLANINKAIEVAKQEYAAKFGAGKVPANLRLPLRDGDVEKEDKPEYAGHYFMSCTSKNKPSVVDRLVKPITDESEIYGGVYGRVSINFYPYSVSGSRGIAAGLGNVQKLEDGQSFGSGKRRAEDEFSAFEVDLDEEF